MKIAIDGQPLSRSRTGIATHLHNIVANLHACSSDLQCVLYSNRPLQAPTLANVQVREDRAFHRLPGFAWLISRAGALVSRDGADVFWAPSPLMPTRLPRSVIRLVTVHDVVWLRYPQTMATANLWIHRLWAARSIRSADFVMTDSISTRDDVINLLGIRADKVKVVYSAAPPQYRPLSPQPASIPPRYALPARYMLAVGTLEPRKNLRAVLKAIRLLKDRSQPRCTLVMAGGSGWKQASMQRALDEYGLDGDDVRILGYVPDEHLPELYSGAQLLLFPSLYEGFGLPPLEAMACGTPVISSDAVCMPEILGDAALFVPPHDVEGFAAAIVRLLSQPALRAELSQRGLQRARRFTPLDSAREFVQVLEQAVASRGRTAALSCSSPLPSGQPR